MRTRSERRKTSKLVDMRKKKGPQGRKRESERGRGGGRNGKKVISTEREPKPLLI